MSARQEGYNDGIAGFGLRERPGDSPVDALEYEQGFLMGSADRWRLRQPRDRYINEQINKVIQPIEELLHRDDPRN